MQSRKYADADFFLAIIKDSDWLKEKAKKIYEKHKDSIWITPFTVVEIMMVCRREQIPIREVLIQISRIAKLEIINWEVFFTACNHIEKGATIFDSLLMAFCKDNIIISSDKLYEKFGFEVISLTN